MKTRSISRVFDVEQDLGYKNLVVGGCSFTYNINDLHSSQWPYYLRDLCNFDEVYDCSLPGAGNQQIATSIQWALETQAFDPKETLVIAMWSGHTRCGHFNNTPDPSFNFQYNYAPDTWWNNDDPRTNPALRSALSIENYLHVLNLKTYLTPYPHVFLDFVDYTIPNRSNSFDLTQYLPDVLANRYRNWFAPVENIYRFCVKNLLLDEDDFHPGVNGHLEWSRQVLAPYLIKNFTQYDGSL